MEKKNNTIILDLGSGWIGSGCPTPQLKHNPYSNWLRLFQPETDSNLKVAQSNR